MCPFRDNIPVDLDYPQTSQHGWFSAFFCCFILFCFFTSRKELPVNTIDSEVCRLSGVTLIVDRGIFNVLFVSLAELTASPLFLFHPNDYSWCCFHTSAQYTIDKTATAWLNNKINDIIYFPARSKVLSLHHFNSKGTTKSFLCKSCLTLQMLLFIDIVLAPLKTV